MIRDGIVNLYRYIGQLVQIQRRRKLFEVKSGYECGLSIKKVNRHQSGRRHRRIRNPRSETYAFISIIKNINALIIFDGQGFFMRYIEFLLYLVPFLLCLGLYLPWTVLLVDEKQKQALGASLLWLTPLWSWGQYCFSHRRKVYAFTSVKAAKDKRSLDLGLLVLIPFTLRMVARIDIGFHLRKDCLELFIHRQFLHHTESPARKNQ